MERFYINLPKVRNDISELSGFSKELQEIGTELEGFPLGFRLEREEARLRGALTAIRNNLHIYDERMDSLKTNLGQIVDLYEKTEKELAGLDRSYAPGDGRGGDVESETSGASKDQSDNAGGSDSERDPIWDLIKKYLKLKDKTEDDAAASFLYSLISYGEKFWDFFTPGEDGVAGFVEWCELAKSSCKLWKGLYKLEELRDIGKLVFDDKWKKAAGGVGVVGDIFGFLGSYVDAFCTGEKTSAEIFAGFADSGKDGVDVVKSIYDLFHLKEGKEASYVSSCYSAIVKSYIELISQGAESAEKYLGDGKWDVGDGECIAIEASISALDQMVSALTFDIVDLEAAGTTPESFAAKLEDGCRRWGNAAGEYITGDPEKQKKYENASKLERTGMIIDAIIKTAWHH